MSTTEVTDKLNQVLKSVDKLNKRLDNLYSKLDDFNLGLVHLEQGCATHGPQFDPPGQSMWPSTMAEQKNFFFFKSIYLAICTVYNTQVVFSIL